MKANLYIEETIIGIVSLEITDETMGVLSGILEPNENYINYQNTILQQCDNKGISNSNDFNYKLELENGYTLTPEGGIGITQLADFIDEIFIETAGNNIEKIKNY
jgi:hypothetical protein